MKAGLGWGPKNKTGDQAEERRKWAEPQLVRRARLPRVTNGMAGSFNPNGAANGGPNQSGTGGKTRDWSNEP